jgi:hypothetical protein
MIQEAKAASRPIACTVIGHKFVCSISVAIKVIRVSISDVSIMAQRRSNTIASILVASILNSLVMANSYRIELTLGW